MKIMIISDLHYQKRIFRVDESKAWEWLLSIVDYHRPDLLISLGDWGEGINPEEFFELLGRVRVWSIYGNHENLEVLKKMHNVLVDKYEPVLFEDGEVREFSGLRFGGINGIIALRRREKKGVPRKRPEEFISIAQSLKGKVDVLLLHDSPYLPEYKGRIAHDERTVAVAIAIYEVKPKLALSGHLHLTPHSIHRYEYGTLHIRIDSSQKHRTYLTLHPGMKIKIWRDFEVIEELEI